MAIVILGGLATLTLLNLLVLPSLALRYGRFEQLTKTKAELTFDVPARRPPDGEGRIDGQRH
jgi:hypothetical protein